MMDAKQLSILEAIAEAVNELGYRSVKQHQQQVIECFVGGSDVFGVLPTGYGKSLCYACLPLVFDKLLNKPNGYSIVLIASPLVAIMKDQVRCR